MLYVEEFLTPKGERLYRALLVAVGPTREAALAALRQAAKRDLAEGPARASDDRNEGSNFATNFP